MFSSHRRQAEQYVAKTHGHVSEKHRICGRNTRICVRKAQNMWPKHTEYMCPKSTEYVAERFVAALRAAIFVMVCSFLYLLTPNDPRNGRSH